MADGTILPVAPNTWVAGPTATTICNVMRKKHGFDYYYTTVGTGGGAPAAPTAGIVPAVAVPLFGKGERSHEEDVIVTDADADVYFLCISNDSNIGTGSGSLRVQG